MHVDPLVRRPVHLRVLLGRADQRGDPGGGVVDLAHQQLGLHRVGEPAHAPPSRCLGRPPARDLVQPADVRARRRRTSAASSQPPVTPCSSSQSPSSSSRSAASIGGQRRAPRRPARRPPPAARPASCSAARSSLPAASIASLCRMPGDPVAQRGGGPDGRRGRVVQLVGQPGGQRAEREQPLALADRSRCAVAHAEEQALEQVHRHREPLAHRSRRTRRPAARRTSAVGDRAHGAR